MVNVFNCFSVSKKLSASFKVTRTLRRTTVNRNPSFGHRKFICDDIFLYKQVERAN